MAYEDDLSVNPIGLKLDEARRRRAAGGQAVVMGKVQPGVVSANAANAQAVSALETQYAQAVGNPGAATGAILNRAGQIQRSAAVPALQTPPQPPMAPTPTVATAAQAPAAAAPQPVLSAPPPAPVRALPGVQSGSIPDTSGLPPSLATPISFGGRSVAPTGANGTTVASAPVTPPTLAAPPTPTSTVPYEPIKRTVGEDGTINITGSGQPPGYVPPPLAPQLSTNPDLSTRAKRREFDAGMRIKEGERQDRQFGTTSQLARDQFGQNVKVGDATIESGRATTERANFDTQLKARKAEAERVLASGQHTPEQEQGLRTLAGLTEKYKPQTIKGDPISGTPDRLVLVDTTTGHTVDPISGQTLYAGSSKKPVTATPKTVAPQAALDMLKKNPAMKEQFKQKYGYLPAGA